MKVIEFCGMPRAGKTTQVMRLKSFLETKGYKVGLVSDRELSEAVKVRPIESLGYILVFFGLALDAYFKHLPDHDFLLMDRGFNDAASWAYVRLHLKLITQEEYEAFVTCFAPYRKLSDIIFRFDVTVDEAMVRHETSGENLEVDQVAINRQWLEAIQASYGHTAHLYQNVISIDGHKPMEETEALIQKEISSQL
jgi:thymidylate kinase